MKAKTIGLIILIVLVAIFVVGNIVVHTEASLWYFKTFQHLRTIVIILVTLVVGVLIGWFIPSPIRKKKTKEQSVSNKQEV
ncbi:hypothetical protein J7J56_04655 [candidate division WOR-3 bacterium]|nr:hypothetical protein [candidate division WOR-3 bacterium]